MKRQRFKTNINCENCLRTVTPFLNEVDELEEWSVALDDPERILSVQMEADAGNKIIAAVERAGFKAMPEE